MDRLPKLTLSASLVLFAGASFLGCITVVEDRAVTPPEAAGAKEVVVERKPRAATQRTVGEWTSPRDEERFRDWPRADQAARPEVAAHVARGDRLFDRGRFDDAITEYTQAIRLDPKLAYAYCNRGTARRRLRHYRWALHDLTKAIELQKGYSLAYNNRGYVRMITGDPRGAIRDYDQALSCGQDPHKFPSYRTSMTFRNRAKAWRLLGDRRRARRDLRIARKLERKARARPKSSK